METIKINPTYFVKKKLSTFQIKLLALIEEYNNNGVRFTLNDDEIAQIFNYKSKRQPQVYIKDLSDRGIITRNSYGTYVHSRPEKSGFVKQREIKINYDVLDSLI